jgi:hypothetical protein
MLRSKSMTLFLGKKAARPGAMKIKLDDYIKPRELPKVPARFGNLAVWNHWQWGMLGNATAGCCVFSGFGHQTMAWSATTGKPNVTYTDDQILGPGAYGETGYVRGDDSTDNGTDMVQACQWWKDKGFFGHTIRGFAQVSPSNLASGAFIFGSAGVGLKLTQANIDQFNNAEPWDVTDDQNYIGGHYVPAMTRNSLGNLVCITWARLQAMTPAFIETQCDEAVIQVSDDWLNAQQDTTPRGLKLSDLLNDMNTMANS